MAPPHAPPDRRLRLSAERIFVPLTVGGGIRGPERRCRWWGGGWRGPSEETMVGWFVFFSSDRAYFGGCKWGGGIIVNIGLIREAEPRFWITRRPKGVLFLSNEGVKWVLG